MSAILHLGPLAIAADRLLAVGALWLFVAAGSHQRIGGNEASVVPLASAIGFVVARLAYVASHFADFSFDPLSALKVWQGGFHPLAGILAAVLVLTLRVDATHRFRLIVLLIAVCGSWYIGDRLIATSTRSPFALPSLRLTTLNGSTFNPQARAKRPLVINLWADWCPPCRHEMPALARAAREHPDVDFLFVNQGDSRSIAAKLPTQHGVNPATVLLDQRADISADYGGALPTTIFVDPTANVRSVHSGEISRAAITDNLALIKEIRP